MTPSVSDRSGDIVVGFADQESSTAALEAAIEAARHDEEARLVVVHASSSPITVRNGPTPEIARAMGEPAWATVYSTVLDRGAAPDRTLTIVEPGDPVLVIARHCAGASVVYLGPSHRRLARRRGVGARLGAVVDCPVVQVAERPTRSRVRARSVRPNRALALQPKVTS